MGRVRYEAGTRPVVDAAGVLEEVDERSLTLYHLLIHDTRKEQRVSK